MRARLFVSALFAASLFAGGAMADRPGDDGGRNVRMPPVREMRPIREMPERHVQPADVRETPVRDTAVTDRLRVKGDVLDRPEAKAATQPRSSAASVKAQRQADKARQQLNARKNAVINCAPTDESCASAARPIQQGKSDEQARAHEKAKAAKERADIQKKIDAHRAERMREKIMREICENKANACKENL